MPASLLPRISGIRANGSGNYGPRVSERLQDGIGHPPAYVGRTITWTEEKRPSFRPLKSIRGSGPGPQCQDPARIAPLFQHRFHPTNLEAHVHAGSPECCNRLKQVENAFARFYPTKEAKTQSALIRIERCEVLEVFAIDPILKYDAFSRIVSAHFYKGGNPVLPLTNDYICCPKSPSDNSTHNAIPLMMLMKIPDRGRERPNPDRRSE